MILPFLIYNHFFHEGSEAMKHFSARGDVPMFAEVTRSTVAEFVSTVSTTICHRRDVMSENLSNRRSALARRSSDVCGCPAASVSTAWAGNITYNLVDYPVNEADMINGGTDTISGTIITDGTLGYLTTNGSISQIIGGS